MIDSPKKMAPVRIAAVTCSNLRLPASRLPCPIPMMRFVLYALMVRLRFFLCSLDYSGDQQRGLALRIPAVASEREAEGSGCYR
jgi:hypothetical protein